MLSAVSTRPSPCAASSFVPGPSLDAQWLRMYQDKVAGENCLPVPQMACQGTFKRRRCHQIRRRRCRSVRQGKQVANRSGSSCLGPHRDRGSGEAPVPTPTGKIQATNKKCQVRCGVDRSSAEPVGSCRTVCTTAWQLFHQEWLRSVGYDFQESSTRALAVSLLHGRLTWAV